MFVVRIISQLVQELKKKTFNDKASYKAVLSNAMLKAVSGYLAGVDMVSSGIAVNVTLAGASRMTRHTIRSRKQLEIEAIHSKINRNKQDYFRLFKGSSIFLSKLFVIFYAY